MKSLRAFLLSLVLIIAGFASVQAQEGYRDHLRDTLSPNGYYELVITGAGDMDWYKVGPVNDVGSLAVILAGHAGCGDLDIEVWGGTEDVPDELLGSSLSAEAREYVLVDTAEHYWFWVRVYGAGDASGDYSLITAHNLAEKAGENLRQTIPPGQSAALYITGEGDEDWYRIGRVEGMGMMTVRMRGEGATGDLDMLIFGGTADSPTDFLGAGVGAEADEDVRVSVDEHYWFWVRVFPNGDASGDYSLSTILGK